MSCTFGFAKHAGESEIRRLFHSFRRQYTSPLVVNFERVLSVHDQCLTKVDFGCQ